MTTRHLSLFSIILIISIPLPYTIFPLIVHLNRIQKLPQLPINELSFVFYFIFLSSRSIYFFFFFFFISVRWRIFVRLQRIQTKQFALNDPICFDAPFDFIADDSGTLSFTLLVQICAYHDDGPTTKKKNKSNNKNRTKLPFNIEYELHDHVRTHTHTNAHVHTHITDDSGDDEQALIESQANSRLEIDISKSINHLNNIRTTTAPTTTTTTTQAATASKAKNCRGLIQKRAHTLDDFMEGNQTQPV